MSKFARKWKKEIEIEDDDDDEPIAEKFLVNQLTPEDVFLYFCLFILNIFEDRHIIRCTINVLDVTGGRIL